MHVGIAGGHRTENEQQLEASLGLVGAHRAKPRSASAQWVEELSHCHQELAIPIINAFQFYINYKKNSSASQCARARRTTA